MPELYGHEIAARLESERFMPDEQYKRPGRLLCVVAVEDNNLNQKRTINP